jgi:hypothetical protein
MKQRSNKDFMWILVSKPTSVFRKLKEVASGLFDEIAQKIRLF